MAKDSEKTLHDTHNLYFWQTCNILVVEIFEDYDFMGDNDLQEDRPYSCVCRVKALGRIHLSLCTWNALCIALCC